MEWIRVVDRGGEFWDLVDTDWRVLASAFRGPDEWCAGWHLGHCATDPMVKLAPSLDDAKDAAWAAVYRSTR